jgi:hypothetical protein
MDAKHLAGLPRDISATQAQKIDCDAVDCRLLIAWERSA